MVASGNQTRDRGIDILRGLAILTMVFANMAADLLAAPHPLGLRIIGTFAAPLFIFIAGMMVVYTAERKGHRLPHFLLRGSLVILVGVLVDVFVWKTIPFLTVDVLYLIGVAIPLTYLFSRLKPPVQWAVVLVIFVAAPLLQKFFGYIDYPAEILFFEEPAYVPDKLARLPLQWLIDGWFPLFPWLGFAFLGAILGKRRWDRPGPFLAPNAKTLLAILLFTSAGIALFVWRPGPLYVRDGYSEMFYPPTVGYMITAVGVILFLFDIVDRSPDWAVFQPMVLLGNCSLLIYILHSALIEYGLSPYFSESTLSVFIAIYLATMGFLWMVALAVKALKARWKEPPYLIHFLLGG